MIDGTIVRIRIQAAAGACECRVAGRIIDIRLCGASIVYTVRSLRIDGRTRLRLQRFGDAGAKGTRPTVTGATETGLIEGTFVWFGRHCSSGFIGGR